MLIDFSFSSYKLLKLLRRILFYTYLLSVEQCSQRHFFNVNIKFIDFTIMYTTTYWYPSLKLVWPLSQISKYFQLAYVLLLLFFFLFSSFFTVKKLITLLCCAGLFLSLLITYKVFFSTCIRVYKNASVIQKNSVYFCKLGIFRHFYWIITFIFLNTHASLASIFFCKESPVTLSLIILSSFWKISLGLVTCIWSVFSLNVFWFFT